jgi:mannose-6-phosphate isomerase-like protein (cupin superfamily)
VTDAIVLGPGEGDRFTARGSVMAFKATAATTHGSFSFMERELSPGGRRPPAHLHFTAAEGFYVLDGWIRFWLDDDTVAAGPGSFILAPGGVRHTFANEADAPARLLVIHAPAMDGYFGELHELWADPANPPAPDAERELMRRHGMEPA